MKVLIAGGSGGIGCALVQSILDEMPGTEIHATFHNTSPEKELQSLPVEWHKLDLTCAESVEGLSRQIGSLDWIVNTVGMLHTDEHLPEKSITQLEPAFFSRTVEVNVLPTLLLAGCFQNNLKSSDSARFVSISARVGSIGDNRLGGWYSYRASKAALNMVLKTLSNEWKRKLPNCCVAALHPGTVATHLSEPFQKNVPAEKLFSAQYSAEQLIGVIRDLTAERSGQFLAYDGTPIPW
ncbi:SDR family NAD(P)-dependent oxidoreductase [Endozoicomonas arenosclerae]|uniref:SDR family NAD(P)-dependent oxidoreductase n=1 Tax=Endozoicomonas arenosclerae TaxID=1633495 RepID=UPI000784128E|nr:SDR family NAD(P)-dependent oxidoreductase [Endozoicomonas arenosclerae]